MLIGSFGLRLIITIFIIEEVFGNMNEIINALYQRKSVRVFTDDPITDEDKKLILTSAIQAPSAGCQLLYTILDITDQTKKDRLADLCDHQAFVLDGYRIVYGGAVRPGRVRRVADLHTRDGFGNLSHALDHRNFKVKT